MLAKSSRFIPNTRILGAAAVLMATAGGVLAQTGEMVSLRSDGVPPDSMSVESSQPAVTPDGRYVVFLGSPTNLVAGVSAGNQIYLRDRLAGTVELISVDNAGTPGNSSSNAGPAVSDDGCKVVFSSFASNLVTGDSNGAQDVFVRDRCSTPPATSAVSVGTGGAVGNRGSNQARLSGNGRYVVFNSAADLVSGTVTSNTSSILYVRDLSSGSTSLLGTYVDSNSATKPISGSWPDISTDGSRVAFWSYGLLTTETFWQIRLYDRGAQTMKIVSSDAAGNPQNGTGGVSTIHIPAISGDGRIVVFASTSNTLVSGVTDGNRHVYVKNVDTGAIELADVSSAGVSGNSSSSGSGSGDRPSISLDGTWVTFWTQSTNLAPNSPFSSVILRNTVTRQTTLLTSQSTPSVPVISGNAAGRYIAFFSSAALDSRFPTAVSAHTVRGYFLLDQSPVIDVRTYVPAANAGAGGYTSFLRVINTGYAATPVSVAVINGTTGVVGTAAQLVSSLPAGAAVTFTAQQVEAALGQTLPAGDRPRIRVTANSRIEVQSFMSNPGGVVTQITDALNASTGYAVRSYVPAANAASGYTSFIRVINIGTTASSIQATVIDDTTGVAGASGQLMASLPAGAAVTFTAQQIETAMGSTLSTAGRPRISISAGSVPLEVQSFMANPDGTVTQIGGAQSGTSVAVRSYIPAASASSGYSGFIRVINTSSTATPISVSLLDGATGQASASGQLVASLPAGAAKTFSAQQVETALGLTLAAGDRPRILVTASVSVDVQSFMSNPGGTVTQLSGAQRGDSADIRTYIPAGNAAGGYASLIRVINTGSAATPVTVAVIDGAAGTVGASAQLTASLAAGAAVTFTAQQMETALGQAIAAADRPRIRVTASASTIEVQSFMSNPGGVITETVDFQ
jgi:hypothetical protein